jgi:hypothetical protein
VPDNVMIFRDFWVVVRKDPPIVIARWRTTHLTLTSG